MKWKDKLNKRETDHLKHFGIKNIKDFKLLRAEALRTNTVFPRTTACLICKSIAKKLGILKKEI